MNRAEQDDSEAIREELARLMQQELPKAEADRKEWDKAKQRGPRE